MPILTFFEKMSPGDKLRDTKAILSQWIEETQAKLRTPVIAENDELWQLGHQDNVAAWTTQRTLVAWLETHPEAWTAAALEDQLRSRFRRCDEVQAALLTLPGFEDDDELDSMLMNETERKERQQVKALLEEHYTLHHECDILACFLGVPKRRIHDIHHIILAQYENEELKKRSDKVEAATYYPLITAWVNGTGTLKTLPIPTHFSSWMTEHQPLFPTLI